MSDVLWWCLLHFAMTDEANAAIHTTPVRYSPITFRIVEALTFTDRGGNERPIRPLNDAAAELWQRVSNHLGQYPEDAGRVDDE